MAKRGAAHHHESRKGQHANETARDLNESKSGVIKTSTFPELPFLKGDKTAMVGFDDPIIAVDEKGKVVIDRYWDAVAEGYYSRA